MPIMPRWMLCFDASAPRTCVALGRVDDRGPSHDELLFEDQREDPGSQTSAHLHLRLGAALEHVKISPAELGVIACGRGPGTFTGSRVAVATAKGLAVGLGIPVVPVSTLAALAGSVELADHHEVIVLALLDARREQVYGALFEVGANIQPIGEEQVTELEALVASLPSAHRGADVLALGPGCGPYAEQLPTIVRERMSVTPGPTAAGLWRASVSALRAGAGIDPDAFTVTYLRQSYAQMGIHPPKRPVFKSPFIERPDST
jgi:tRNA threonylcarbamoyladenosine biosynthesis protein TsaB